MATGKKFEETGLDAGASEITARKHLYLKLSIRSIPTIGFIRRTSTLIYLLRVSVAEEQI